VNPWDNPAWVDNVKAMQSSLSLLIEFGRKVGCSIEYLEISADGKNTLEAVCLEAAPPDGYPERGGAFVRFFPDPDLLEEGGPVDDETYAQYFPDQERP
jgi:hypothetical protein